MEEISLNLRTLTPLWTGGVETGTMDRIHESGILGSLRWWYETIVRGLGGDVCDATSDRSANRCPRSKEKYCDVCELFGATGMARSFRLSILSSDCQPLWQTHKNINIRPYGRQRGWYLPPGWIGNPQLRLIGDRAKLGYMATLLLFLSRWGALGAKQPLGYGRFAIVNREDIAQRAIPFGLQSHVQQDNQTNELPNIRDFLFFQVQIQSLDPNWWKLVDGIRQLGPEKQTLEARALTGQGMIPVSPVIKNAWRFGQKWPSRQAEGWLFGMLQGDRREQSKVSIGWAIQQDAETWAIPGWVWLPRERRIAREYALVKQQIQRLIQDPSVWQHALALGEKVRRIQVTMQPGAEVWQALSEQVQDD